MTNPISSSNAGPARKATRTKAAVAGVQPKIRVRAKRLDQIDQTKLTLAYWLLAKQLVDAKNGTANAKVHDAQTVRAELRAMDASADRAPQTASGGFQAPPPPRPPVAAAASASEPNSGRRNRQALADLKARHEQELEDMLSAIRTAPIGLVESNCVVCHTLAEAGVSFLHKSHHEVAEESSLSGARR
jgi:hypothetical protein